MGLYFSFYLFKLGLAPPIQDLYGKVNFTGMALCRENWAELSRGACHQCSGVPWQEGTVLDAFCQSCLRSAHPSVGVSCTPLGLAGEWGLCWLPLLHYWATVLVLSSAASALLQRKRSTT